MSERVLILGATSAIAAEVALLYAARGARLHLVARNAQKLAALCERLPASQISQRVADFSQLERNAAVIEAAFDEVGGFDCVLVAHGDLGDQLASEGSFDAAEPILRTNFNSVVSLLIPVVNRLEAVRAGRLGVITSVAGERGRPRNYTYAAAKGALNIYLQGLRSRLYSKGVKVTTLKLGPVDTPMTISHRKNALFAKPPTVARDIVRALDAGKAEVFVPAIWAAIMPIVTHMPERVFQLLPFLSGR